MGVRGIGEDDGDDEDEDGAAARISEIASLRS